MHRVVSVFIVCLLQFGMLGCDGSENDDLLVLDAELVEEVDTGTETTESAEEYHTAINGNDLDLQLILQLVNEARGKGVRCDGVDYPPVALLKWNRKLENAALKHSQDMNSKNYFSHTSKDGSSFADRILAAGYRYRVAGENIAKGHPSELDVVNGWLKSPGHCANIMNGEFTEMGVARDGDYWTQDFGAPRD